MHKKMLGFGIDSPQPQILYRPAHNTVFIEFSKEKLKIIPNNQITLPDLE